ncbi:MAG: ATP-binding protein, partial [Candidatus Sumerlaeia bacterium]|nr:ATP-binding protein [Candidatus Sumerlaeia bacterium]
PPPQPLRYNIVRTSESVILRLEYPPDSPSTGPRSSNERPPESPGFQRPRPQKVISQRTSEALVLEFQYSPDQPTSPLLAMVGLDRDRREGSFRRGGRRPPPFGRPPWMNETEFQEILQKQGLHGFVLKMSTDAVRAETARDRWLRFVVMSIALVAVVGVGLAWRAFESSAQLQIRLTRASEMNAYLREMNVAAAGLAHETRNPLNIVRGLAQMISNTPEAPPEIRKRSSDIAEEVDRVTARLNEFIDYSKPREAKPAPTNLTAIIRDVERTLESDITDKAIAFTVEGPDLTVEADESLLRQVLFNLLMNAIQAVSHGGSVAAVIERKSAQEAVLEIRDNGPGIPADAVKNLFRPYFTMHERGTGLGLAIVRQIVLAHGWEIQYLPNEPQGARFQISGIRISARAPLS